MLQCAARFSETYRNQNFTTSTIANSRLSPRRCVAKSVTSVKPDRRRSREITTLTATAKNRVPKDPTYETRGDATLRRINFINVRFAGKTRRNRSRKVLAPRLYSNERLY